MLSVLHPCLRVAVKADPQALLRTFPKNSVSTVSSTVREAAKRVHVPKIPEAYFDANKSAWLSDPGVFPLIGIIGSASTGCLAFFAYNLSHNPDIRLRKDKRKAIIRWWD